MEAAPRVPLTRRDWVFIAVCVVVIAVSAAVITNWFSSAFPEASIDFRYDGSSSRAIADRLLAAQHFDRRGMKHTAVFDSDDSARIFLERSLGLRSANEVIRRQVRLWYWHHRWFRPLQEEEFSVDIAPTGELVSMTRTIPESRRIPSVDAAAARRIAEEFLARTGASNLELLSQSERQLPARVQRIYTWRSRSVHPAGAEYRHTITVDGDAVSSYSQALKVPEEWLRNYHELRSKNNAAGNVDLIFLIATTVAALVVFVVRLRRGDLSVRFLLGVGAVTFILSAGASLNSYQSTLAYYDTTTSYAAHIARFAFLGVLIPSIGSAMLLIVITGAGEVLFRERLPRQLALPSVWTMRSLTSKRVFRAIILGYTLVAFFIGYQTIFYVIAEKFGAWAPAEIPYDNTLLNSPLPWLAVLFAGFFPAMSEEFMSRAFSIPLFERLFRSRIFAIVLAAYIWGFGHSTYPNQPFYIRGLEVGSAGVILGFLLQSFGLLPLLIWHFTVDAVYTSLMLLRSGNIYYVVSTGLASMIFVIPLMASIVLYVRNGGFLPDDELSNAALPVPEPEPVVERVEPPLPEPIRPQRPLVIACLIVVALAILLSIIRPATPGAVVDYRITDGQAREIAAAHLRTLHETLPARIAAAPVSGFRSWDAESGREEGGSPGGFNEVAATYMIRHGMPARKLVDLMRTKIPTATWTVRLFTPMVKTEYFVEIDPRTSRVVGYHKYADEQATGAHLDRSAALAIAEGAFATYGAAAGDFHLKDALTFEQPHRRDWLFHFEAAQPLIGEAARRVSIRVMGSAVTQYATTVKVPDAVVRDAHQQTFLNIILLIIRILGVVSALALVISGFIMATRHGVPLWRRAARVAAVLSVVPVVRAFMTGELRLFTYSTSTSWDTFLVNATTNAVRAAGLQILMIVASVAAIFAVAPYARAVLSRQGRTRFGRHAALAVLTAAGLLVSGREIVRIAAHQFPSIANLSEVSVPDEAVLPLPLLLDLGSSIVGAVVFAGAAAAYSAAARNWKNPRTAPVLTMATVFCVTIDSTAKPGELPLMLATSAALAVLVWVIGRHVLDGNPLAWPLAAFTTSLIESGVSMIVNHRLDLQVQGSLALVIAIVTLIWVAWEYRGPGEAFISAHAAGD